MTGWMWEIRKTPRKFSSFPRGRGNENPIKLQELKNKERVFLFFLFSSFQNHVGGLPERLIKTKQKPTTGSYIMCRQVHTHTQTELKQHSWKV